ncbi:uncharacterized protein O9250_004051 isoform 2-T2 [Rhynochetos jubatus]
MSPSTPHSRRVLPKQALHTRTSMRPMGNFSLRQAEEPKPHAQIAVRHVTYSSHSEFPAFFVYGDKDFPLPRTTALARGSLRLLPSLDVAEVPACCRDPTRHLLGCTPSSKARQPHRTHWHSCKELDRV